VRLAMAHFNLHTASNLDTAAHKKPGTADHHVFSTIDTCNWTHTHGFGISRHELFCPQG